jgi:hypothetical protein
MAHVLSLSYVQPLKNLDQHAAIGFPATLHRMQSRLADPDLFRSHPNRQATLSPTPLQQAG